MSMSVAGLEQDGAVRRAPSLPSLGASPKTGFAELLAANSHSSSAARADTAAQQHYVQRQQQQQLHEQRYQQRQATQQRLEQQRQQQTEHQQRLTEQREQAERAARASEQQRAEQHQARTKTTADADDVHGAQETVQRQQSATATSPQTDKVSRQQQPENAAQTAQDVVDDIAEELPKLKDDLESGKIDPHELGARLQKWLNNADNKQQLDDDQLQALQALSAWLMQLPQQPQPADMGAQLDQLLAKWQQQLTGGKESVAKATLPASDTDLLPQSAADSKALTSTKEAKHDDKLTALMRELGMKSGDDTAPANKETLQLAREVRHALGKEGTDNATGRSLPNDMAKVPVNAKAEPSNTGGDAKASHAGVSLEQIKQSAQMLQGNQATSPTSTPVAATSANTNGQSYNSVGIAAGQAAANQANVNASARADAPLRMQSPQMAAQLGQQLVMMVNKQRPEAEIRLDPPELGSMLVKVNMKQDQTHVSFQVQHSHAREAIESAIPRLRDMLAQQGINLGQADVSQRDTSAGENSFAGAGQGGNGQQGESDHGATNEGQDLASGTQNHQWFTLDDGRVDYYA